MNIFKLQEKIDRQATGNKHNKVVDLQPGSLHWDRDVY